MPNAPRRASAGVLVLALVAGPAPVLADDVDSFLDAIELDPSDLDDITTVGNLDRMLQVRSDLGILNPQEGSTMGLMFTGNYTLLPGCQDFDNAPNDTTLYDGPAPGDTVTVEFDAQVPPTANSLVFSFYFLSREYPIYVGSEFNDQFTVMLTSDAWNGNIVFDAAGNVIDVNNALFVVTNPADLSGTGFHCGDGGGTGWVSTIAPVEPGETIHLAFSISDLADSIYDSAVLIDDFYWSELDPDEPYTGDPLQVFFLSPKRGSVDGGETTVVYGTNFTSSSKVYFDGVELDSQVLSDERISVVTPPHEPGYVDVTVKDYDPDSGAVNQELTLLNGYTYYDISEGELPPEFSAIEPDYSHVDGGQDVTIRGDYFQSGAIVTFDGIEGTDVVVENEQTIRVTTPAHEAGVASVVVLNADGQETDPPYPFTYSEDVPEAGAGGDDDEGGDGAPDSCGGSCDQAGRPAAGTLSLLGLGAAALGARRRRLSGRREA